MKHLRSCELCKGEASVYCEPDSAFLCWACDAGVHGANFLVARHVRAVACAECGSLDASRSISGAGSRHVRSVCRSCDPGPPGPPGSPSLSSASCVSSAESAMASAAEKKAGSRRTAACRRRGEGGARAERVLARWSRKLGLRSGRTCVGVASHVLGECPVVMAVLPFRVCVAAALWFGIKVAEVKGGRKRGALLSRLEACSGVPAKVIVLAEARLAR